MERKPLEEMTLEELWQLFPIKLIEHQDCWAEWFYEESTHLAERLPAGVRIHHIGSTVIPGIWAKPTVDMLVEADRSDFRCITEVLLSDGYSLMSEGKKRLHFCKGYTPEGFAERVFHLHLAEFGDADEILFRDYLVAHPESASEYEKLKLSLWKRFEHDRDGYTYAKTEFVKHIVQEAHCREE